MGGQDAEGEGRVGEARACRLSGFVCWLSRIDKELTYFVSFLSHRGSCAGTILVGGNRSPAESVNSPQPCQSASPPLPSLLVLPKARKCRSLSFGAAH